jgi:hypothetical protein
MYKLNAFLGWVNCKAAGSLKPVISVYFQRKISFGMKSFKVGVSYLKVDKYKMHPIFVGSFETQSRYNRKFFSPISIFNCGPYGQFFNYTKAVFNLDPF